MSSLNTNVLQGCHQLKVTGGGSTTPSGLVSFPGAYKATDPGITFDAYKGMLQNFGIPYIFPWLTLCSTSIHYSGTEEV